MFCSAKFVLKLFTAPFEFSLKKHIFRMLVFKFANKIVNKCATAIGKSGWQSDLRVGLRAVRNNNIKNSLKIGLSCIFKILILVGLYL